ncbi:hypothetical protein [Blastococcus sp. SYSU DS1024]
MTAQAGKREALRAMGRRRGCLVLFVLAGVAVHLAVVRPRQLTWGATAAEVARSVPGDDLVTSPTFDATRAITIAAPPEEIWPWLVQVGVTRAGWYSYDLLDNLGRPSARSVVPRLQHLAPGDVVPMSPDGRQGMRVHSMDPPQVMVWGTPGDTTWAWRLEPCPDGTTRVLTRIRSRIRSRIRLSPMSIACSVLLEVADFWMIRKMLLNLRARAEGLVEADGIPSVSKR